jgi:hypothetical protein
VDEKQDFVDFRRNFREEVVKTEKTLGMSSGAGSAEAPSWGLQTSLFKLVDNRSNARPCAFKTCSSDSS